MPDGPFLVRRTSPLVPRGARDVCARRLAPHASCAPYPLQVDYPVGMPLGRRRQVGPHQYERNFTHCSAYLDLEKPQNSAVYWHTPTS